EKLEEPSGGMSKEINFRDAIATGVLQGLLHEAAAESLTARGRFDSHGAQQDGSAVALEGGAADHFAVLVAVLVAVLAEDQEIFVAVEAIKRQRGFGEKPRDAREVGGFGGADGERCVHVSSI